MSGFIGENGVDDELGEVSSWAGVEWWSTELSRCRYHINDTKVTLLENGIDCMAQNEFRITYNQALACRMCNDRGNGIIRYCKYKRPKVCCEGCVKRVVEMMKDCGCVFIK